MSKSFALIGGLSLLASVFALAQVGETGLSFLKLGVGGRALGMGEAYAAIASDPAATYYNPASLSLSHSPELLFMHKEWIKDTRTEYFAAKTSWHTIDLGLSINGTAVNNIEIRESPGPPQETFSAHNAAIGISGACKIESTLGIGLTGKYLYEKILVSEASGFAVDIGTWYQTPWDTRIAFVINNIGSMNELQYDASKLPTSIRFGIAYERSLETLDGGITIASDLVSFTGEHKTHLHLGIEMNYRHAFSVRLGYQTGYNAKSFSSGVGFRYGGFQIDYAFIPIRYDLGTSHTVSVGMEFW